MGVLSSKCRSTARLDGKTVVITGCNTGIGKECVKEFYLRGAKVIMACRNLEKATSAQTEVEDECKNAPNVGSIQVVKLDLTSLRSVRECAKKISDNEEKIDILLNNAGVMMCPKDTTEDNFEMQIGTNHFGHFLFTLLLLPRIIASNSQPARIVNVSSMAHWRIFGGKMNFDDLNWKTRRYNSINAYAQSKLANVLFTKELARRLQEAGINHVHTYSLHPGVIKTELGRNLDQTFFKGVTFLFLTFTTFMCKSPQQGAQTSIYCSLSEDCAKETGLYYQECSKTNPSYRARNKEDAKRLWEESLLLTGLGPDYNFINP